MIIFNYYGKGKCAILEIVTNMKIAQQHNPFQDKYLIKPKHPCLRFRNRLGSRPILWILTGAPDDGIEVVRSFIGVRNKRRFRAIGVPSPFALFVKIHHV